MINRRQALQRSIAASAGVSALAMPAQGFPRSKKETIDPVNPHDPLLRAEAQDKKVLIVGGGIAGMSAAMELAERKLQVTLREAAPWFGGKLHTRSENLPVGKFQVEHGLHMWFHNYFNFYEILDQLGLRSRYFKPFKEVYFEFKDYEPEVISSNGPYPANLLGILNQSPNLNLLDAVGTLAAVKDIIFFDHDKFVEEFDDMTFHDWAKSRRVNEDFFNVIMEPAASVTLNDPAQVSAAEMLLYMHYYFIGDPRAFHRTVCSVDHGTGVINPWMEYLKSLGVDAQTNQAISGLVFEENGQVGILDSDERWDQVVLAVDVPGAHKIMQNSVANGERQRVGLERVTSRLLDMKIAPPYHVLRVWFDQPTNPSRPDYQSVIETPQHQPINLLCLFHMLEEESATWALQESGSVIEYHLYDTPAYQGLSAEEIWAEIKSLSDEILPELQDANPLAFSLGAFENFTSFEVGQASLRPEPQFPGSQGLDSLTLAGDWTKTAFPTALMERAVSSGFVAANHILKSYNIRQRKLYSASSNGPGLLPRF